MVIKLSSVKRGADCDARTPELEISAENSGTVVLRIYSGDGKTQSGLVEVGTVTLIGLLTSLGVHDAHETLTYEQAVKHEQAVKRGRK